MDNIDRVMAAETALDAFAEATDYARLADMNTGDRETYFTDLLSDMMHWADENGIDFLEALRRAQVNYDAEARYD